MCQFAVLSSPGRYSSEEEFLHDLKMMWFGLYSRYAGKMDSSGFEHIFAGMICVCVCVCVCVKVWCVSSFVSVQAYVCVFIK